jgi:hypothetical protein
MKDLFTELEQATRPYPEFFNTVKESGSQLIDSNRKATKQNDVVYELFKQFKTASPSQILQAWGIITGLTTPPITSIRRAITTLTDQGKLEKLESKQMGLYGKVEHEWRLVS